MTTYTGEALERFGESADQLVSLFLTMKKDEFEKFAQQWCDEALGTHHSYVSPPSEVVKNVASMRYQELIERTLDG